MAEALVLSNRLVEATSPYLLQHKDNPVHWQLWDDLAFNAAKKAQKPILLSIGYAACHWCHVMAHECFENPQIAELMNRLFVNIKLDREERPDLDHLYMSTLHMMGVPGGWPMTMFLNHEAMPFYGGTYFPPESRYGRPGFPEVLNSIAATYKENETDIADYGDKIRNHLLATQKPAAETTLSDDCIEATLPLLVNLWDKQGGGMSGAPKFPQAPLLLLLSLIAEATDSQTIGENSQKLAAEMLDTTLSRMAHGGIYDHIGGGFARYSVDEHWFVPHFEKMLYDNAQLISVYSDAWNRTGEALFAARTHDTIAWLKRDMLLPEGAFATALDADSEGKEGLYYLQQKSQIDKILGTDSESFCRHYNISEHGNWNEHGIGYNIPHTTPQKNYTEPEKLINMRQKLLTERNTRIAPERDDKILCDCNGYAISALAKAAVVFAREDYFMLACHAFTYISDSMLQSRDGQLYRCARQGKLAHQATLTDYAACIIAAIDILSASGFFADIKLPANLKTARNQWTDIIKNNFRDKRNNQLYMSHENAKDTPIRMSEWQDNATPAASANAALALAEIAKLNNDTLAYDISKACLNSYAQAIRQSGFATPTLIRTYNALHTQKQIIVSNPKHNDIKQLRKLSQHHYRTFIITKQNAQLMPQYITDIAKQDENNKICLYRLCANGTCAPASETLP